MRKYNNSQESDSTPSSTDRGSRYCVGLARLHKSTVYNECTIQYKQISPVQQGSGARAAARFSPVPPHKLAHNASVKTGDAYY
eukprot:1161508-Pelagomonas_calceolata.AAC.8